MARIKLDQLEAADSVADDTAEQACRQIPSLLVELLLSCKALQSLQPRTNVNVFTAHVVNVI